MPLPGIPIWNDQDIVLYHGTLDAHVASILQAVDLNQCKHFRDFGRGFYTTTKRTQAERWANDRAVQIAGAVPAVIEFTVERNDIALLDALFFVRGTAAAVDFWSFVQFCRSSATDHGRAHASLGHQLGHLPQRVAGTDREDHLAHALLDLHARSYLSLRCSIDSATAMPLRSTGPEKRRSEHLQLLPQSSPREPRRQVLESHGQKV